MRNRTTVDAARWTRPAPAEVRRVIEATGLSQCEVGRRLGVGERRVRHWLAERVDREARRIDYTEWLALRLLALDVDGLDG